MTINTEDLRVGARFSDSIGAGVEVKAVGDQMVLFISDGNHCERAITIAFARLNWSPLPVVPPNIWVVHQREPLEGVPQAFNSMTEADAWVWSRLKDVSPYYGQEPIEYTPVTTDKKGQPT